MHEYVSFNGKIVAANEAVVSAVSSSLLYGRGVFTTMEIREGTPASWELHWARLQDNAARTRLAISAFSEGKILTALTELIKINDAMTGLARMTFFDETAGKLWQLDTGGSTGLLITTKPPNSFTYLELKLTVSPYRVNSTSPLAGIKSCNYLENILALEEAQARGFGEGVRLNERGEIASACMANVFWKKNGRLFTPGLKSGCLAGTTRAKLIAQRGAAEVYEGIEALETADEIFLTSVSLGEGWVSEFNGRVFEQKVFF